MVAAVAITLMSPFAAGYREVLALGFHPVPLIPGTKEIKIEEWTRWCDAPPTENELAKFARKQNANIGAAMGSPVGDGTFVICIDIDVRDDDEIERIKSAILHSPMARFGSKGLALFFRAPAEIRSTRYRRLSGQDAKGKPLFETIVEILAHGKQVALPPSIHPDTGSEYIWIGGSKKSVRELPLFDADALERLEEAAEALGWAPGVDVAGGSAKGTGETRKAANDNDDAYAGHCRHVNEVAFERLDSWVPALGLYKCQKKSGGYRAVATWRASNRGRPLEERGRKLSIDRRGIVDFGSGETFSAADLVMAAMECGLNDALAFLWERTGLKTEQDEWFAKFNPWLRRLLAGRAAEKAAARGERHLTEAPDGTLTGESILPLPATPTPVNYNQDGRDFPEYLTHIPGLLGDMVEYIVDTSRRPSRALALGAALVTLGTIIGRRDATPTGSGTHLYVIALAPSGAGKDHPQEAGTLLLEAAAMELDDDLVGAPDFMSQSGFLRELEERPLRASFMDEFGAFLAKVNAPRAGNFEVGIKKVLLETWGKSFASYRTPAWAGTASKRIQTPAYSIFGASTPMKFYEALQGDDRENGFLNRMLLMSSHAKPALRDPKYHRGDIPTTLVDELRAAYRIGRGLLPPGGIPAPRAVSWEYDEAKVLWDAFARECDESDLGGFAMRSAEMAGRLATIVAVGRQVCVDYPTVSVEDIRWAIEVARWSAVRMAKDAGAFVADNPVGRDRARILAKLNAAPGKRLAQSDIMRDLGFKSSDLATHIRDMVDMGQITPDRVSPANGGKPKVWLVAV